MESVEATAAKQLLDVLIIGAGPAGICAAATLARMCPTASFAVLEKRPSHGGTWLVNKFPGSRSDNDMYAYAYSFAPWEGSTYGSRDDILKYLGGVIRKEKLSQKIRYGQSVRSASWNSTSSTWTVVVDNSVTGVSATIECRFLFCATGYFDLDKGYVPKWPGLENYRGRLIHPQTWPECCDLTTDDVLVIGSGSTAATVLPAIAGRCKSLTMLQRTPTYMYYGEELELAFSRLLDAEQDSAKRFRIAKELSLSSLHDAYQEYLDRPEALKTRLLENVRSRLSDDQLFQQNFVPPYAPFTQRMALIPKWDFVTCVAKGRFKVITDGIERFTETGVITQAGTHIDASVIVSATGFELKFMENIDVRIDGIPFSVSESTAYRGCMLSGVPNLAFFMGSYRFPWTLRAEAVSKMMCRLLSHMTSHNFVTATPGLRENDQQMRKFLWAESSGFVSGYNLRGQDRFPRQGENPEWRVDEDGLRERDTFETVDFNDGCLQFR